MHLVDTIVDALLVVNCFVRNLDRRQVSVHVILHYWEVRSLEACKLPRMTGPLDYLQELTRVTVQVLS